MKHIKSSILLFLLFLGIFIAGSAAFVFAQSLFQNETVDVTATVQGCGDGICDGTETCDICPGDCGSCGGGATHTECSAKKCAIVSGSGTNQCAVDSDCSTCDPHGDINRDGSINVVDFSIMMYFWKGTNPSNPCADLNKDTKVDLTDFSIMLYWWTK